MDDALIRLKAWWKSVTIWVGGVIVVISQIPPDVLAMLHPDLQTWAYTVAGLSIIYMRFRTTNQAVTLAAAQKPVASDRTFHANGSKQP